VIDGFRQAACTGMVTGHGADQAVEAASDRDGGLASLVAQDVCRPVHPAIDPLDVRPGGSGAVETAADQFTQPRERRWRRAAPFSTTRSRLSATASSRALSFSPEAASGGRPSSVMALRTAAQ
jgi:hypothetical protein